MKRLPTLWAHVVAGIGLITVAASGNEPPNAYAGKDTAFIMGLSYTLSSEGTTDDSLTKWNLIYAWAEISGPDSGIAILSPNSRNSGTTVSKPGEYRFELTVSDSELSDRDTVVVTVLPAVPFLVLTPDTGDTIYTGASYTVTWQVYPPTGMHVYLSVDNGLTYERLNLTKIDLTDTFFVWTVSDTLPESDECIIEVSEYGHHEIVTYSGLFHLRAGPNKVRVPLQAGAIGAKSVSSSLFSVSGRRLSVAERAIRADAAHSPSIAVQQSADGQSGAARRVVIAR